jgi:hypothetical protein
MFSAIFLLRNPLFLDDVPEEHKKDFIDSDKLASQKLKILKKMIRDRFPVSVFAFAIQLQHNGVLAFICDFSEFQTQLGLLIFA